MVDDKKKPNIDSSIDAKPKSPFLSDSNDDSSASRSPTENSQLNQSTSSTIRRLKLILFLILVFWAGIKMSLSISAKKKPEVIYASRYSNEFKFRPAASPIITETLKDGRIRLRGAYPEPTSVVPPLSHGKKNSKRKKRT